MARADETARRPGTGEWVYAGFWIRVWAAIIDTTLVLVVLFPILDWLLPSASRSSLQLNHYISPGGQIDYRSLIASSTFMPGPLHILLYWVLPAVVVVLFWLAREATPGKMAIHARIVDATTGRKPASRQLLIRYLGYYVSTIPFALGLVWVGLDARKQGWHDKMAHTVVIRPKRVVDATARFDGDTPDSPKEDNHES